MDFFYGSTNEFQDKVPKESLQKLSQKINGKVPYQILARVSEGILRKISNKFIMILLMDA